MAFQFPQIIYWPLFLIDKMKNAIPMKVPLVVEIGEGNNWLEAH